jgi:hypothetical protein
VSVVCCQVEVSATGWSLVQRSPTECGMSNVCDREASKKRGGPGPYGAVEPYTKRNVVTRKLNGPLVNEIHPEEVQYALSHISCIDDSQLHLY